jgi:hypothetical protein
MKMWRWLLAPLLLVTATAGISGGLENSTPSQRAALQTEFMKDHLDLDAAAMKKVQDINQHYAELSEPVLKGDLGLFEKRTQMKALMASKDQALKAVLDAAQFDRYESLKDDLKAYLDQKF